MKKILGVIGSPRKKGNTDVYKRQIHSTGSYVHGELYYCIVFMTDLQG